MERMMRHVPNILTLLRLIAVPAFASLMLQGRLALAAWLFLLTAVTDVLDGVIARRYDAVTPFGRVADPAADKLMQLTALFLLAARGMLPYAIAWIFLIKELVMLICGVLAIRGAMDTSAKWYGKLASAGLFVGIMLTFFTGGGVLTSVLLWLCVAVTLFALYMYGRHWVLHRSRA